jgi:hypothetical protein
MADKKIVNTPSEFLETVKQLLLTKGWNKGAFAVNAAGLEVNECSDLAARFCLLGAMSRTFEDMDPTVRHARGRVLERDAQVALMKEVQDMGAAGIAEFNDDPDTDLEEVVQVLDRVINKLELQEANFQITDY